MHTFLAQPDRMLNPYLCYLVTAHIVRQVMVKIVPQKRANRA